MKQPSDGHAVECGDWSPLSRGDWSPPKGCKMRIASACVALARARVLRDETRPTDCDGDKSPRESGENSPHSKAVARDIWMRQPEGGRQSRRAQLFKS